MVIFRNKYLRFFSIVVAILLLLLLLLTLSLRVPAVQNYAQQKVLESLSEQYDAQWSIDEIRVSFIDQIKANGILLKDQAADTLLIADQLIIDIGLFSLLNKKISIDNISIDNAQGKMYELPDGKMNFSFIISDDGATVDEDGNSSDSDTEPWSFDINTINLDNIKLSYKTKDLEYALEQDILSVDFDKLDLENQIISIAKLNSQNAYTYLDMRNTKESDSSSLLPDLGWTIDINDLEMYHKLFEVDANEAIKISELNIEAEDLIYQADSLMADIKNLKGNYNNQVVLEEGAAKLNIHLDKIDASQLNLQTKNDQIIADQLSIGLDSKSYELKNLNSNLSYSLLKIFEPYVEDDIEFLEGENIEGRIKSLLYNSAGFVINNVDLQYGEALKVNGSMSVKTSNGDFQNLRDIYVNVNMLKSDIQQLDGMLSKYEIPDSLRRYQFLTASGIVKGDLILLELDQFSLKVDDALDVKVGGVIRDVNRPDILSYDLTFEKATVNTLDLPYTAIEQIDIPALGQSSYVGKLSGDMNTIKLDGDLESALGSAQTDIVLGIGNGADSLSYNGNISLLQFDLGTLLKDESLGKITVATTIDGKGISIQDGNTKFVGVINDFEYKAYSYNVIKIDAKLQDGQIDGIVNIDDPNAMLQYDGSILLGEGISAFDFSTTIDTINLNTLNLYPDAIGLSGAIESRFTLPLKEGRQDQVLIKNFNLSNLTNHFYEDSISITALKKVDSTLVMIDSDMLQLQLYGEYEITDLPAAINDLLKTFIDTDTVISHAKNSSSNIHVYGQLNTLQPFDILLAEHQLQSNPLDIDLKLDFKENSMNSQIEVDSFYYDDFFSEKLLLTAANVGSVMDVDITGEKNSYSGTPVNKIILANSISDNNIESILSAFDKNSGTIVKLTTESEYSPDKILIAIQQDSFIINNKEWEVRKDNLITIENACVNVSNLELESGREQIEINSDIENTNELSISFENFELEEFTTVLLTNGSTAGGLINGEVDIKDFCSAPYFIANIAIDSIVYDSTFVGLLEITGDTEPVNSMIYSDIKLSGPNNKVDGSFNYNSKTRGVDVDVAFDSLQLMLLDPFLENIMKESEGYLSGKMKMGGSIDEPSLIGNAKFHNAITTIVPNNTRYSLDDHEISFDDNSIDIGDLDLYDEEGNSAKLSGKIYHQNLKEMVVDLNLDTEKFIFLNTTIQENPVFSGRVLLEAQGDITGPPSLLDVNISAKSLNGTEILISPYSAETYLKEDFITYGKPEDFEDLTDEYLLQLAQAYPFDVSLDLEVTEDAKLTIVVDPINGDKVEGRGFGDLKIQLDEYGQQEFYGRYTVKDGTYNFSYGSFIFKEFDIEEGGSVLFNGDLLDAVVDIAAIHNVYTTTYELIKDEVTTLDASDLSNTQKRTNVDVYLTLKGPLDNTDIALDIKVPNLESSSFISPVERKLAEIRNDPNELNSQVFGLLLFNSFLVQETAGNGIGNVGSDLALSSISDLISNQLNKLAQNNIKGLDVSFNVNSYDSEYVNSGAGGNVTELGLEVSKQIFNDRLSISATGNVDLEENDQQGYSSVVGDFVLDYKLTQDGRYRLRVFSKTDYDRLLNENNNKNGIGLFFKKSFDSKIN